MQLMRRRNDEWINKWKLSEAQYHWDLKTAEMHFRGNGFDVLAEICCIGTASHFEKTFLWSWANEGIPEVSRRGLDRVQEFGRQNNLPLLTTAEWAGGEAEGKEMVAIAGRILDGQGIWVDKSGDVTLFFVLNGLRAQPSSAGSPK